MGNLWKPLLPLIGIALAFSACEDDGSDGGGNFDIAVDNDVNVVLVKGDCISGAGNNGVPGYASYLGGFLPGRDIVVRAGNGDWATNGASEIGGDLEDVKPGYVLILYGKNDVINSGNLDNSAAALFNIVDAAVLNGTQPIIGTLPGMSGQWEERFGGEVDSMNSKIRSIASSSDAILVDLYKIFDGRRAELIPDGRHPSAEGSRLIAKSFAGKL